MKVMSDGRMGCLPVFKKKGLLPVESFSLSLYSKDIDGKYKSQSKDFLS
jgi:hypothetical protein